MSRSRCVDDELKRSSMASLTLRLGHRVTAWWWSRQPRRARLELGHRNIYILPTAAGWMYAVTVLTMLVGSINYQLNLGYALSFWLAAVAVVSMHQTHRTLAGLRLHVQPVVPVHAGEPALITVVLEAHPRGRHALLLGISGPAGGRAPGDAALPPPPPVHTRTRAGLEQSVELLLSPALRGRHPLPGLRVETRFPFGLFRAWSIWRPAGERWVWPAAESPVPPMDRSTDGGDADPAAVENTAAASAGLARLQALARSAPEPSGVRPWQRGDALNRVVWKKSAGMDQWISRDSAAPPPPRPDAWLRESDVAGLETEAAARRLTAWLLQAQEYGQPVGLQLEGLTLPPQSGEAHLRRGLEALALWRLPPKGRA